MAVSHVKGSLVVGVVKVLRAHDAEARKVLPANVVRYLDERILLSTWYPELDAMELYRAMAKVVRGLGPDPFRTMGRTTAHDHASNIYKNIVAKKTVEELFTRIDTLWKSQHDVGDIRVVSRRSGSLDLELIDHACLNDEWCRLLCGYFVGMASAVAGKEIRCEVLEKDFARKRAVFRIEYT